MTETHIDDFHFRVLLSREDGESVARALEMDLLGYGETDSQAICDLQHAIEAQISFARQMKDESLILFPADDEYFERWEKAHRIALTKGVLGDKSIRLAYKAATVKITLSAPSKGREFTPVLA